MDKPTNSSKHTDSKHTAVKRRFQGVVASRDKNKTLIVKVNRVRMHRLYKKRYTVTQRYHVHDEKNQFVVGDTVEFVECRPISKHKRWRVIYPN